MSNIFKYPWWILYPLGFFCFWRIINMIFKGIMDETLKKTIEYEFSNMGPKSIEVCTNERLV